MIWRRTSLLLAFDATGVQAARLVKGLRGRDVERVARRGLDAGALRPLALEANIARAAEVQEAARAVIAELGGEAGSTVLVLPDGVARLAVVDVPAGSDAREYARFRLASQLPYPAAEAIVDSVPAGGTRHLAAAVRRDIVAEYEAVGRAVGVTGGRVELAPVAGLAALRRAATTGPQLDVVLGDAAFSMALSAEGALQTVRNRRRDPGPDEAGRLGAEVERTVLLSPSGAAVRVVGAGARRVVETLRAAGLDARSGWGDAWRLTAPDTEELAWLGAGLA
jgi:hypothetical protein